MNAHDKFVPVGFLVLGTDLLEVDENYLSRQQQYGKEQRCNLRIKIGSIREG